MQGARAEQAFPSQSHTADHLSTPFRLPRCLAASLPLTFATPLRFFTSRSFSAFLFCQDFFLLLKPPFTHPARGGWGTRATGGSARGCRRCEQKRLRPGPWRRLAVGGGHSVCGWQDARGRHAGVYIANTMQRHWSNLRARSSSQRAEACSAACTWHGVTPGSDSWRVGDGVSGLQSVGGLCSPRLSPPSAS